MGIQFPQKIREISSLNIFKNGLQKLTVTKIGFFMH